MHAQLHEEEKEQQQGSDDTPEEGETWKSSSTSMMRVKEEIQVPMRGECVFPPLCGGFAYLMSFFLSLSLCVFVPGFFLMLRECRGCNVLLEICCAV